MKYGARWRSETALPNGRFIERQMAKRCWSHQHTQNTVAFLFLIFLVFFLFFASLFFQNKFLFFGWIVLLRVLLELFVVSVILASLRFLYYFTAVRPFITLIMYFCLVFTKNNINIFPTDWIIWVMWTIRSKVVHKYLAAIVRFIISRISVCDLWMRFVYLCCHGAGLAWPTNKNT